MESSESICIRHHTYVHVEEYLQPGIKTVVGNLGPKIEKLVDGYLVGVQHSSSTESIEKLQSELLGFLHPCINMNKINYIYIYLTRPAIHTNALSKLRPCQKPITSESIEVPYNLLPTITFIGLSADKPQPFHR